MLVRQRDRQSVNRRQLFGGLDKVYRVEQTGTGKETMLVAFSFCQKDQDLALRNAQWITTTGGCKGHRCISVRDVQARNSVIEELRKSFDSVGELVNKETSWVTWPQPQNKQFQLFARWLEYNNPEPFLWLEADAVPLKPGWLDKIEAEYKRSQKPFMGAFVPGMGVIGEGGSCDHMSGVSVYPGKIVDYAGSALIAHEEPWDVAAAKQIVPLAHFTDLIQHKHHAEPFKSLEDVQGRITSECVIWHDDKTGSLIDILNRERIKEHEFYIGPNDLIYVGPPINVVKNEVQSLPTLNELPVSSDDNHADGQGFSPNDFQSLTRDTIAILKQLCRSPYHTSKVRKQLREQGVIK